ncbi:MAG: hypothetical protein KIPDCIKN_02605 [Haliscomenobacter sp.]|nr:hypothetical protein [Haliscomenobacter sp.]
MKKESERPIKDVLLELMRMYRLKQGNNEWRIKEAWPRLFGEMIHRHTKDLRLSRRTLYVRVDSAPLRQELVMAKEKIRKTLNEELQENFLEEVVIR